MIMMMVSFFASLKKSLGVFCIVLFVILEQQECWSFQGVGCSSTRGKTKHRSRKTIPYSLHYMSLEDTSLPDTTLIAGTALILGIAANQWINRLIKGDDGLGNYLKDGSGYRKSAFRLISSSSQNSEDVDDPLPWLKLPQLDFVQVAGQQQSSTTNVNNIMESLESLRLRMNQELKQGNLKEAVRIREELEAVMQQNGIEFTATDEQQAR